MSKRKKSSQVNTVAYVRGFHLPTVAVKKTALGSEDNNYSYSFTGHQSIPKCTSRDDWLAQYEEEGQTVGQFLNENPWFSKRKRKYVKQEFVSLGESLSEKYPDGKLYLLPLGELDMDVEKLCEFATNYLGVAMRALPALITGVDRKKVWVQRRDGKKHIIQGRVAENGRMQLNAPSAIQEVRYHLNEHNDGLCVIALTKYELYETRSDLFVAGLASGNQRVGVFSVLRYNPNLTFSSEFWYDVRAVTTPLPHDVENKMVFERSLKLLVHEIMHLLGLDHCIYFACVMNGSGNLEEDFNQPIFLCPVCLKKMFLLTKFDIPKRYEVLKDRFQEFGMVNEVKWVSNRMEMLELKK